MDSTIWAEASNIPGSATALWKALREKTTVLEPEAEQGPAPQCEAPESLWATHGNPWQHLAIYGNLGYSRVIHTCQHVPTT